MTWFRNQSPMRATEHSRPPHISKSGIPWMSSYGRSLGDAALFWGPLGRSPARNVSAACVFLGSCLEGDDQRKTCRHAWAPCALGSYLAWSNRRQIPEPICFNRLPAYARRGSAADRGLEK